jgi:histone acetyltransferase (RNA polymerase elongator complex component)
MSTRPDYISGEIIDILHRYTVSQVELGIQSFSEKVLLASKRGHTPEASYNAMRLLKSEGFSVVGQMMTGLPSSTLEAELYTARRICQMGACGARIYPTVVFRGTELHSMMERGEYESRDIEQVVNDGARVLAVFLENGVNVIRV